MIIMAFRPSLTIITFMILCVVGHGDKTSSTFSSSSSTSAAAAAKYWNQMLPNTPMPQTIKDSLYTPTWFLNDEKSTSVTVGNGNVGVSTTGSKGTHTNVGVSHGGVTVDTGGKQTHTDVGVSHGGGVAVSTGGSKPGQGQTSVGVGHGGVAVDTGKPGNGHTSVGVGKGGIGVQTGPGNGRGTSVGVGKGGVAVHTSGGRRGHRHPVYVGVHPGPNPFIYNYAASGAQLRDDRTRALFFLEKDLRTGMKLNNLRFTSDDGSRSSATAPFLPRGVAESIPFSSGRFNEVLSRFSLGSDSVEARSMKETVDECERTGGAGEGKYCATSLESMVDFVESKLGKTGVKAVGTETTTTTAGPQAYTVVGVRKVVQQQQQKSSDNVVACHKESYPYAVYLCHKAGNTVVYKVSMVGAGGGGGVEAVAVCHKDTSEWNPNHLAFQVLKVKPGTVPVCHFLPKDHIVWVRN